MIPGQKTTVIKNPDWSISRHRPHLEGQSETNTRSPEHSTRLTAMVAWFVAWIIGTAGVLYDNHTRQTKARAEAAEAQKTIKRDVKILLTPPSAHSSPTRLDAMKISDSRGK